MVTAFKPPWVNFTSDIEDNINNAGVVILTATVTSIIDSLIVSNKTNGTILASVNIIREGISHYLLERFQMSPFQSFDFLASQGQTSSVIYLKPGDVLFAQSDAISNIFSCVVSYRELNQLE